MNEKEIVDLKNHQEIAALVENYHKQKLENEAALGRQVIAILAAKDDSVESGATTSTCSKQPDTETPETELDVVGNLVKLELLPSDIGKGAGNDATSIATDATSPSAEPQPKPRTMSLREFEKIPGVSMKL